VEGLFTGQTWGNIDHLTLYQDRYILSMEIIGRQLESDIPVSPTKVERKRTVKKLNPLEIQQPLVVIGRSLGKPLSAHPGER